MTHRDSLGDHALHVVDGAREGDHADPRAEHAAATEQLPVRLSRLVVLGGHGIIARALVERQLHTEGAG